MTSGHLRLLICTTVLAAILAACGASGTPSSTPSATLETGTATSLPTTAATVTPPTPAVDPCTLRLSLDGQPLSPGPSFALNANSKWQLCLGGVAAGSGEKLLFKTTDGAQTWTLISSTTLGSPTPEAGVGELPNGNGVTQLLFVDATHGWMGLNSPGVNLFRSQDGGVTWTAVTVIPPAVPVTSITFTDAMNGTVVTPQGTWTTTDGGATWSP